MSIDELMKEAVAVWRMEGMDPTDSDSPIYNLHNDPVSKLLLGALNYQSNMISDDIISFRDDLADECLDLAAPFYLFSPRPSFAMLQTAKGHIKGAKNGEKTILDGNMSFLFSRDTGIKRLSLPFMPLLSIAVMDLSVRSLQKVGRNRWRIEIEDLEGAASLEGLSLFFPHIAQKRVCSNVRDRARIPDERISLYVGDRKLDVSNISDFDSLPFTSPFFKSMAFSKNALQCNILQNIQDSFCTLASCYCVVNSMDDSIVLTRHDGCFFIDVELPFLADNADLTSDDILLNCVPIVNVELHSTTLSQNNPVQPIEVEEGFFLSTLAPVNSSEFDSFVLRKVATNRVSPSLWAKKMCLLINQYNAQHNVMGHLLDKKTSQSIQPFLSSVKQLLEKKQVHDDSLFLVLKNKMITSLSAQWLSTSGCLANDIAVNTKPQCSSSELDSNHTRLVTMSSGGRNPIDDPKTRQQAMRYYQISRDRIVSKSDIVAFCRFKLSSLFAVKPDDIDEIRIYTTVNNSSEGFYERILVVDIKLRKGTVDCDNVSFALERMMKFRTASTTPIRVIVND